MKLNIRFLHTLLRKKQWITNQELHHILYGPPRYFIIFLLASFLVMQSVYYSLDIQNFHKYFGLRGDFIGQDDFVTFLYPAPSRAPSENVIVTIGADLRYGPNLMSTITDNNFTKPLSGIAHVFRDSDINFLSLDGPITSSDAKRTCTPHEKELKRCCNASCFWKNDFSVLKAFRELGVNGVGIENEHILDYGREGLEDTLYYLRDARIPFAGMGYRILYKVKECGIAILQYNWAYQEEEVYEKMKEIMIYDLKVVKADVHIVIMHGGNQKGGNKTMFQEEFAKLAIDNGASLVVGTHSRIRQKSEMYKDRKIYYGLGSIMDENFIGKTASTFSLLRFEVAQCKNIVRLKEIKGKKNLKTLEVSVK